MERAAVVFPAPGGLTTHKYKFIKEEIYTNKTNFLKLSDFSKNVETTLTDIENSLNKISTDITNAGLGDSAKKTTESIETTTDDIMTLNNQLQSLYGAISGLKTDESFTDEQKAAVREICIEENSMTSDLKHINETFSPAEIKKLHELWQNNEQETADKLDEIEQFIKAQQEGRTGIGYTDSFTDPGNGNVLWTHRSFDDEKGESFRIYTVTYKEILLVSLPASCEEVIYSIVAICFNYLIFITAGTMEVAIFTVVWRFVSIGFLPCIAIGVSTITVSGIAYGARNYENFKTTINYSTFISFIITLIICAIFFVFAHPISEGFNFINGNPQMTERTAEVLRIMVFYNLFIPFGATAAYVYQGVGSGFKSLALTILRELILSVFFAYLFAFPLKMGIFGVYLGAIIGMILGSFIGFACIKLYERSFKKVCEKIES